MKTSLKLTLGAMALGLSLSSFAQDNANTPASTKADPKVMIQIPDSAMKSGKVIIKDGQVYVRIGKESMNDSGAVQGVVLDDYGFCYLTSMAVCTDNPSYGLNQ